MTVDNGELAALRTFFAAWTKFERARNAFDEGVYKGDLRGAVITAREEMDAAARAVKTHLEGGR